MRARAAIMTAGIAILAFTGISATAQAAEIPNYAQPGPEIAASWRHLGWYNTEGRCIDAGQQMQREHAIREWKCDYDAGHYPSYALKGR